MASDVYVGSPQVDGLFGSKANASDVHTKSQMDGMIPDLGTMQMNDDDTDQETRIISHQTTLPFCINRAHQSNGRTMHYDDDSRRRRC